MIAKTNIKNRRKKQLNHEKISSEKKLLNMMEWFLGFFFKCGSIDFYNFTFKISKIRYKKT